MSFVIEDGSGVVDANSYTNEAFALTYLTDRGRNTENTWDTLTSTQRQSALIKATDYIENKYGLNFRGAKEFNDLEAAKGVLSLSANPSDSETVIIGVITYVFNTVLGSTNSILIGATTELSLDNLIDAINFSSDNEGITFGTGTVIHPTVEAKTFTDNAVVVEAKTSGTSGNLIGTTETLANGSWANATLTGGTDTGQPQPLAFPRSNMFDQGGTKIVGIPKPLKQACVEYAVRVVLGTSELISDPTNSGMITRKKEKVGVIEEETEYSGNGLDQVNISYPAADRLLNQYLNAGGGVIRA